MPARESHPEVAWKAIVTTYLQPNIALQAASWCPLTALAPEMVRTSEEMKVRIFDEVRNYKALKQPFMPGRRSADKDWAFL